MDNVSTAHHPAGLVGSALLCVVLLFSTPCLAQPIEVRGLIVSDLRTTLSAQISGTIDVIHVDMGGAFKKGQVLVRLQDNIQRTQVARLQAELRCARQQLEANHKLQELQSIGTLEVLQSEALVEQKVNELRLYEIQLQQCTVSAPISGRVVERLVAPHQFVTPGTPLLDIIDDKHLSVQAFVPSHWISLLHVGQPCNLYVDEIAMTLPACVTSLGAQIDANSQMLEVRARIANIPAQLLAGMSGRLDFGAQTDTESVHE